MGLLYQGRELTPEQEALLTPLLSENLSHRRRIAAFEKALKEKGLPVPPILQTGDVITWQVDGKTDRGVIHALETRRNRVQAFSKLNRRLVHVAMHHATWVSSPVKAHD